MTLTKFMARSTWVAYAFEWEKLLKCHLKGKASRKLANGQNIDCSEKKNGPRASSAPATIFITLSKVSPSWLLQGYSKYDVAHRKTECVTARHVRYVMRN